MTPSEPVLLLLNTELYGADNTSAIFIGLWEHNIRSSALGVKMLDISL